MIGWQDRSREIANLLNPAFCGEVLRRCINKYATTTNQAFPYPLLFLVLPIILHRETREALPAKANRKHHLHMWVEEHQILKAQFPERAKKFVPITKEAIIFLLQIKALSINEQSDFYLNNYRPKKPNGQDTEEIMDCYKKSEIIGHWFARAGTITTIYTMWGVKP